MKNLKTKTPIWFIAIAVLFLLWNLMGVFSFFAHSFISEEALSSLPDNERELYGEYSIWTTLIFAVAVFSGLIGSIGLLLKKKWAKTAFIISMLAIIPQMSHNLFFTKSIEVYGAAQAATMPIIVVVFGLLAIWFSNHSKKKNWLN